MNLNPWSMLFHAINALLLVIAYRFWMYKPVRKFLDARADKIKAEREEIERDRAAVQKEAAEVKAELDSARIQATKTLRESHARFDMEAAEK